MAPASPSAGRSVVSSSQCSESSPSAPVSVAETEHGQRVRAAVPARRHVPDLRRADLEAGDALLAGSRAAGGRDRQLRHRNGRHGRDVLPKAFLPAVRRRHPLLRRSARADQQRVPAVDGVGEEVPEVALAVAEGDHP